MPPYRDDDEFNRIIRDRITRPLRQPRLPSTRSGVNCAGLRREGPDYRFMFQMENGGVMTYLLNEEELARQAVPLPRSVRVRLDRGQTVAVAWSSFQDQWEAIDIQAQSDLVEYQLPTDRRYEMSMDSRVRAPRPGGAAEGAEIRRLRDDLQRVGDQLAVMTSSERSHRLRNSELRVEATEARQEAERAKTEAEYLRREMEATRALRASAVVWRDAANGSRDKLEAFRVFCEALDSLPAASAAREDRQPLAG